MKSGDIQYISDTIMIERIAAMEFGLVKQAGLFDSLNLGGIASSIKNFVSSHVSNDAPGGYVGSVLALMAPSVLWRINPFVGILYLVASQFGFDIQSVVGQILDAIKPKLEQGMSITSDELTSIGKNIIGQQISTAAPQDLFEPLRKLSNTQLNELIRKDPLLVLAALPETPLLFGGGGSLLQKVFGQLFSVPKTAGKGKWLLGGFIIWLIKTILVGAGLLAGAEAISGALGHKKPETTDDTKTHKPEDVGSQTSTTVAPVFAPPSSSELWVIPLVGNGTVEDTLIAWTLDLYPNLSHYDNIEETIKKTPSFISMAAFLKKDPRKLGTRTMVMPHEFSGRKQVVDSFIDDVIRNLKG